MAGQKNLGQIHPRDFIKFLEHHGFRRRKRVGGSHVKLRKDGIDEVITIVDSKKEVSMGVLKSSLKIAGLTEEDLSCFLKGKRG